MPTPAAEAPRGPVTEEEWERWRAALAARVLDLGDGEEVVVEVTGVAGRVAVTRPSRLFGLVAPRTREVRPWARLVRSEDHLRGELVGSTAHGGEYPMSEDEADRVDALGWHAASAPDGPTRHEQWWPDDVADRPYLPPELADRATDVLVRTLRAGLGADTPADLHLSSPERRG